jgi:hypothetical protein
MKLSDYKKTYEGHTSTLSNINRSIAFAGIAVIWIFKKTKSGEIQIDDNFLYPILLFIIGLAFDMIQYIYQSLAWFIVFRKNEKQYQKLQAQDPNASDEFEHQYWITYPAWIFFIIKVGVVITGFILLFIELFGRVFVQ